MHTAETLNIRPLVSVVIATRNRAKLLRLAVESVINQDYDRFELVIIDDGSEDDTADYLNSLTDERIVFKSIESSGRSRARNTGLSMIKGDLVCFLDDDDTFTPNKLAVQVEIASLNPAMDAFVGKCLLVDANNAPLSDSGLQDRVLNHDSRNFIPGVLLLPSLMIRRKSILGLVFDESLDRFEDLNFYRQTIQDNALLSHQDIVGIVKTHPGNALSKSLASDILTNLRRYLEICADSPGPYKHGLSKLYAYYGLALIEIPGYSMQALRLLVMSFLLNPRLSAGYFQFFKRSIRELLKRMFFILLPFHKNSLVRAKFWIVFHFKLFGKSESLSGPGSDSTQTIGIREILPRVISRYGIRSIADAPCGDLSWIKHCDLANVNYHGFDVVGGLINLNRTKYPGMTFTRLDLCDSVIPRVDMIFCRDLLVHLTLQQGMSVLNNFRLSGSKYLLATTFPERKLNEELRHELWRPLNLSISPFNLGNPIEIFVEFNSEDARFADKSLAIWKIN